MPLEPLEVPLQTEDPVPRLAAARQLVGLVREAHQLGGHAEDLERRVELLALIDRAPQAVVIGVEISATADEGPLSAEVTAALPEAAARVVEEVRRHVSR